ncbi:MAG: protein-disulfide isomerase [Desulfuromonas sp.]|uniref:DsbC family protein n=1 Tax=Desulfuromonas sp. TaxID=892 RepID=UPI000CC8AA84|nr:DsbC family protein [Desulfuromonas sp.]PLX84631.1 MAG: protein-disulfide isomerase [Desulfuromonas sp.]
MRRLFETLVAFVLLVLLAIPCAAMSGDGCGAGQCTDCHSLELEEATGLLKGTVDRVLSVELGEMPGVWAVEVEKGGRKFPLYVDFSKSYLVAGNIVRLKDGKNINNDQSARPTRVDIGKIPLDDALLLGREDAKTKAVVITDPECPYCKRLHEELREVVRRDPDIAFLIKLYPLKMHPNAYTISKSILCNDSLAMLEDNFAGKTVPPPLCETDAVDQTIALVKELGIRSTPTLVLPDGRVFSGFRKANDLLELLAPRTAAQRSQN